MLLIFQKTTELHLLHDLWVQSLEKHTLIKQKTNVTLFTKSTILNLKHNIGMFCMDGISKRK